LGTYKRGLGFSNSEDKFLLIDIDVKSQIVGASIDKLKRSATQDSIIRNMMQMICHRTNAERIAHYCVIFIENYKNKMQLSIFYNG